MKTDALFYELFRLDPHSLFQLVKLNVIGQYVFESITVKTTEKRFDGFFRRKDGRGPYIFLEVQGYYDAVIYWRFFREICAWYEQKGSSTPFAAVVLFLDGDYDPGECPLLCAPPNQLIRKNLADCLNAAKGRSGGSGVLTVLEPLVLSHKKELPAKVSEWTAEIRSAELPENKTEYLLGLLEYAILQRFPKLTLKEIQKMIELTPLEETVAVKELIQIEFDKGEKKGEKKAKEETAVNLMRIGTDVKIISQATGLSQKKIKQLALRSEGSEK